MYKKERRQDKDHITHGVCSHWLCADMCYVIPILSPFLFIQSLYASFLKFIGLFIYLSPLIFIYTQCMFQVLMDDAVWSMQVLKGDAVVTEKMLEVIFWFMVVMEMLKCICILSVTFLHCIVCKFEK